MTQTDNGSRSYLVSIVMVAVLGGLLFGYDTAVISGAEKGLQAFFMEAKDFAYTDAWHGFTSASALIGCIIGSAISGLLATNLGRKKSLIIAGLLFFISALGSMDPEFLFFNYGEPTYSLRRWSGISHLPHVYWRGSPIQHPRHACLLEPVRYHLRPIGGLLCQLFHLGRPHPAVGRRDG